LLTARKPGERNDDENYEKYSYGTYFDGNEFPDHQRPGGSDNAGHLSRKAAEGPESAGERTGTHRGTTGAE
jgi:hypothetical protein